MLSTFSTWIPCMYAKVHTTTGEKAMQIQCSDPMSRAPWHFYYAVAQTKYIEFPSDLYMYIGEKINGVPFSCCKKKWMYECNMDEWVYVCNCGGFSISFFIQCFWIVKILFIPNVWIYNTYYWIPFYIFYLTS